MPRRADFDFGRPPRILYSSPEEKANLEAENALRQFERLRELFTEFNGHLVITPELIRNLHWFAIQGIYGCAGEFRDMYVGIDNSRHVPPNHRKIPELIEEMCGYVSVLHGDETAIHASAYLLWRLNWIHPFFGGNGRTARALAYLRLCSGLNIWLPGTTTVADQLLLQREQYYEALEAADKAWRDLEVNVGKMESLISDSLITQIESAV